jgi:hypothetical protein
MPFDTIDERRQWNGQPVDVRFEKNDEGEISKPVSTAAQLWKSQQSWKQRIEDFTVETLLPRANEWIELSLPRLNAVVFIKKIRLETIALNQDGTFEFWFDDGDVFWGHAILVQGNPKDGPNHSKIVG